MMRTICQATRITHALRVVLFSMMACVAVAQTAGRIVYEAPDPAGTATSLYSISPSGTGNTAINVNSVLNLGNPRWSRDGTRITAIGTKVGDSVQNVFVFPRTRGNATEITAFTSTNPLQPPPELLWSAFSPDSKQIAVSYWYQKQVRNEGFQQCTDVLLFGADGRGFLSGVGGTCFQQGQGNAFQGFGIDWSPDPARNLLILPVAYFESCFFSGIGGFSLAPVTELWAVAPVLGSFNQPTRVTRPCPPGALPTLYNIYDISPVFSPDGTQVAFIRVTQNALLNTSVFSLQVIPLVSDGQHPRQVGPDFNDVLYRVAWSPDSGQLVFDRGVSVLRVSSNGLWLINLDGTGLKQLPNTASSAFAPSWGLLAAAKRRREQLTSY